MNRALFGLLNSADTRTTAARTRNGHRVDRSRLPEDLQHASGGHQVAATLSSSIRTLLSATTQRVGISRNAAIGPLRELVPPLAG